MDRTVKHMRLPIRTGAESPVTISSFGEHPPVYTDSDKAYEPVLRGTDLAPNEMTPMELTEARLQGITGTVVSTLGLAAEANAHKTMSQKAKEASQASLIEGKVELHAGVYPVLKSNGIPIDVVLGQIQSTDAFESVEKELEGLFTSDDLHTSMIFASEYMFVRQ